MSNPVSKRQQARNERTLQDLIKTGPGNDRCADCSARNPGWASWNLGIFLCMRCAGLHRKMGTHVSKVKSLSMDSWNNEQVENMKKIGNTASNKKYNPQNTRPDVPIDVDEADGAMERFVRQKYELRAFMAGGGRQAAQHHTGSTSASSMEDNHAALPPKPSKKFGFSLRSASAVLPGRSSRHDRPTAPISPALTGSDGRASPPKSKPSRVLGVGQSSLDDNLETKLGTLREMGFPDRARNLQVLRATNGNLDRAVETLVRTGEGSKAPSRTMTPMSAGSGANGITIEKRRAPEQLPTQSNNPFDALDAQPPQRSVTAPVPQSQPVAQPQMYQQQTYSGQGQQNIDQIFGAMHISQQQTANQPYGAHNPFMAQQPQQSYTLPHASTFPIQNHQGAQSFSSQSPPPQQSNPFMQQSYSNQNIPNPWQQQQQQQQPFVQSPPAFDGTGSYQPQTDFFQQQQPSSQYYQSNGQNQQVQPSQPYQSNGQSQQPQSQTQTQQAYPSNPYASFQQPQQQYQPPPQQSESYPNPYQQAPQQPFRHDKSSILALYNQPQMQMQQIPQQMQPDQNQQQQQAPQAASMNPFAQSGPAQGGIQLQSAVPMNLGHASKDSVDFVGLGGGRHSPDAFRGLSARFT